MASVTRVTVVQYEVHVRTSSFVNECARLQKRSHVIYAKTSVVSREHILGSCMYALTRRCKASLIEALRHTCANDVDEEKSTAHARVLKTKCHLCMCVCAHGHS